MCSSDLLTQQAVDLALADVEIDGFIGDHHWKMFGQPARFQQDRAMTFGVMIAFFQTASSILDVPPSKDGGTSSVNGVAPRLHKGVTQKLVLRCPGLAQSSHP